MKILTILLIPLFWEIVSATPPFREVNLIKDELSNFNNHEKQRKISDLGTVIPDEGKLEADATRSELCKRSQFRKDSDSSLDEESNINIENFSDTFLNGLKFGKKLIDDIVQSFFKFIPQFNSKKDLLRFEKSNQLIGDVFKDELYEIQKKGNTKPQNAIVDNEKGYTTKSDKSLKSMYNFKNEQKIGKIDEETLHSIIPQIITNENQRSSKSGNNEHSDKSNNDEFESKRRQLYTEATGNVLRNKRDTHIPLCNTLNKDSKNCLVNSNKKNAVLKNKQPSIVESLNTDLGFTKMIQKANPETANFNEFQIDISDGEFRKWLDNDAEYYFDYSEPLNTSPKYSPIAINMKATSTQTPLNKKPDKLAPIKTYVESDYKDLNLKWPNDEEYEFNKDLKKSSRTWQDDSAIDETILIPSEWDLIDKTMNDNNNAISNANSISKTTTSKTANLEVVSDRKEIYIPSDWIVKYKMMSNKNDDILFSKVVSSAGTHVGANSKTGIVLKDEYKPLKSIQSMVQKSNVGTSRSGTNDAISKSKQVISTATEAKTFVNGEKQKLSTWGVDDTIVNGKSNIAVPAKSIIFTKANVGNVTNSENNQKLIKWNIKNTTVNDKNISNGKATAPGAVYPASDASNESKRESSQYTIKNNQINWLPNNPINNMSKNEIKANATAEKEVRAPREDKNEQIRKTVNQKSILSNKNNSAIIEEGILSKTVNFGIGVTYPAENSNTYEIQVPSEWIVKYESLNDKDDSLKFAKVISTNSNVRNNKVIEDTSNWTNESEVTKQRKDKWSGLKTNAKSSVIQAAAVSTEKIEKLPYKRVKDNTQINKVVESTKTDAEATAVNNKDKEQWNNNEKVPSLNSQSATSAASNIEVATTTKSEKEQWKWNDTDKDLIIKNDIKSDNKATTSVEINAVNVAGATNNKNRQWNWNSNEKTQSMKDNGILNTKETTFAAGNSKTAASVVSNNKFATATQNEEKQWNWVKNNKVVNMKNYDISNNKKTGIVEDTYDAGEAISDRKFSWTSNEKEKYSLTLNNKAITTDATIIEKDKQKWKWDDEHPSVQDNVLLNNQAKELTVANNITMAGTESEIKHRIWNYENKMLSARKVIASSNETIATIEVSANSEPVIENDRQQEEWNNKENVQILKEDGSSKSVTNSSAKANANAVESTLSNKKTWKWDRADEVSSDKYGYLTVHKMELTSGPDVIAASATDGNKHSLKLSDKNENFNQKGNIISNSKVILSAGVTTNSQAAIKDENLQSIWDNKENAQIVKEDDSSNSVTILSAKANANAAEASSSKNQTWKKEHANKISSNKYGHLTPNERNSALGANVKAVDSTISNTKLLKLIDKNENQNEEKSVILNSMATASSEGNANSQAAIKDENLQSIWDNKENAQIVKEDVSSNGVSILSAKANANAAEASSSKNQTWKREHANKISSNKYGHLTPIERNSALGANVKAVDSTVSNTKLLKLIDKNENQNEEKSVILNSMATASSEGSANSQAAIKDENLQSIWDNKENAQIVKEDVSSNGVSILSAKANANAAEASSSKNQTWKREHANKISSNKYGHLTPIERNSALGANVKAVDSTVSNTKLLKLIDKNENQNEEKSVILNSMATASSEGSANSQAAIKDENLQSIWDNKENAQIVKEDVSSNGVSILSAKANANAAEASSSKNQTWKREHANKISSNKYGYLTTNTAESTISNKNTWKWNRADEVSSNIYDYLTANGMKLTSGADFTATVTSDDNKKSLKINDKNKNLNEKPNIISNSKAISSTQSITDVAAVLENSKNQWEWNINNKSQIVKDDLIINNQSTTSAISNANATSIIARNKLQSKSNDESNDPSIKNDVTSKNKTTGSIKANSVAAVTIENEMKLRKFEDKNKNLSIKNNVSMNNKTTIPAGTKINAATIMTDDQQQRKPASEDKNQNVKYIISPNKVIPSTRADGDAVATNANSKQLLTFNDKDNASSDKNDNILNLESAASIRANYETADATTYENRRILGDRNKNPKLKVDVTSNTEKTASARTNEETETGVTLMTNNDNRKIFGEKTSEMSNLKSISETFPSTIATAETNLENKNKSTLPEYNINVKKEWVRKDFISNSMIAASATAATKASSTHQNKEKLSDGIAETSVSSVINLETDSINENKEKLQSLRLKNSNLIEYDNSTATFGTFANNQIESNISKEEENKLSDQNNKANNSKDNIDAMTVTKTIAYTVNKGDIDTLSKEDAKLPEWKIKETNEQSHQDLISHGKTMVSATAQARDDSVMEDQNKPLNKKVENNNSYNNDLSIVNISTATKANFDLSIKTKGSQSKCNSILKDTEISKNSLENTKTSALTNIEAEMNSVNEDKNKQFDRKIDSKNLMDNSRVIIEAIKSIKAESNSVSTSNDIDKQIKWKYKEEDSVNAKDKVTDGIINNESNNLAIISSKEKDIINSLNKISNDLINWLVRWKLINVNAVKSNNNEQQNETELNYLKLESSNDGKYTIDELNIPTTTDDKIKGSEKKIEKMDDDDLIVIKKPYGRQNTIGITYIKDSVPPMVIYRVIPISVFEQVRKLIKQWEIIYTEYAELEV